MITIHDVKNPKPEDLSPFYDSRLRDWDVIAVKGAPDVVLGLCTDYQTQADETRPLTPGKRAEILAANDAMTSDALRVLAWPIASSTTSRTTSKRSRPRASSATSSSPGWWG